MACVPPASMLLSLHHRPGPPPPRPSPPSPPPPTSPPSRPPPQPYTAPSPTFPKCDVLCGTCAAWHAAGQPGPPYGRSPRGGVGAWLHYAELPRAVLLGGCCATCCAARRCAVPCCMFSHTSPHQYGTRSGPNWILISLQMCNRKALAYAGSPPLTIDRARGEPHSGPPSYTIIYLPP